MEQDTQEVEKIIQMEIWKIFPFVMIRLRYDAQSKFHYVQVDFLYKGCSKHKRLSLYDSLRFVRLADERSINSALIEDITEDVCSEIVGHMTATERNLNREV